MNQTLEGHNGQIQVEHALIYEISYYKGAIGQLLNDHGEQGGFESTEELLLGGILLFQNRKFLLCTTKGKLYNCRQVELVYHSYNQTKNKLTSLI